jgi:hypothetical protein
VIIIVSLDVNNWARDDGSLKEAKCRRMAYKISMSQKSMSHSTLHKSITVICGSYAFVVTSRKQATSQRFPLSIAVKYYLTFTFIVRTKN